MVEFESVTLNLTAERLLPAFVVFVLIFAILYAIFQKTKILGDGRKNINSVVSIMLAFLVVLPNITGRIRPEVDPVVIISKAIPSFSIIILAAIMLLILIGVFGQDKVFLGLAMPGWIAVVSFAIIVIIFGGAAGWWTRSIETSLERVIGPQLLAVLIMLLVFGILISWITREGDEKPPRYGFDMGKLYGGGGHGGGGGHH